MSFDSIIPSWISDASEVLGRRGDGKIITPLLEIFKQDASHGQGTYTHSESEVSSIPKGKYYLSMKSMPQPQPDPRWYHKSYINVNLYIIFADGRPSRLSKGVLSVSPQYQGLSFQATYNPTADGATCTYSQHWDTHEIDRAPESTALARLRTLLEHAFCDQ